MARPAGREDATAARVRVLTPPLGMAGHGASSPCLPQPGPTAGAPHPSVSATPHARPGSTHGSPAGCSRDHAPRHPRTPCRAPRHSLLLEPTLADPHPGLPAQLRAGGGRRRAPTCSHPETHFCSGHEPRRALSASRRCVWAGSGGSPAPEPARTPGAAAPCSGTSCGAAKTRVECQDVTGRRTTAVGAPWPGATRADHGRERGGGKPPGQRPGPPAHAGARAPPCPSGPASAASERAGPPAGRG